ncbi:hypothetical protein HZA42_00500 [Candidatus Peregrinibacteria bacterium]|nr:hypothetical protein [Candidatus Peregrinibacteria bacterium]
MSISYASLPFIGGIATLLFMLFVLVYRPKTIANLLFLMFCLTTVIWLFGTYKMFIVSTDKEIVFWDHFVYIGVTLMSVFLYHFGVVYLRLLNGSRIQRAIVIVGYVLGLLFLLLSQFSTLFVSGVFRYSWGAHTIAGPLHHVFLIFFLFYFFGFLVQLIGFCRHSRGVARSQLCYVLVGFCVFLVLGPFAFLPAYKIPVFPVVFIVVIPFILLLFHAMFKYEFLSNFDELLIMRAKDDAKPQGDFED